MDRRSDTVESSPLMVGSLRMGESDASKSVLSADGESGKSSRWRRLMSDRKFVALPCRLSRGIFSSERGFELTLANGELYSSLAPSHFCWNSQGKLLVEGEAEDKPIEGYVAGRVIEELDGDQVAVEVPDGEVLAVRKHQVRPRPTPIYPPGAGKPA
jgi:hypothetical protein